MIGKALKYMRKKKKFNQGDMASVLHVARNTVSQYETEVIQPTFKSIESIANKCGFDIWFIDREDGEKFKVDELDRKDV